MKGRGAIYAWGLLLAASSPTHAAIVRQADVAKPAPQVVTDEAGRKVAIPAEVRRIVSLAPNLTETIYALGAGDRLVGDTDYCDVPADARSKPHVGAPISPSLEAIVGLKPDLVLATVAINRLDTVEALEHLGIAVYATDERTVEGMLDGIERLAELIGAGAKGEALVAQRNAQLKALHQRLAGVTPRRVLFITWMDPLISVGPNTFLADALKWAGAESMVTVKQKWPHISIEEVVRLQPEYLIFTGEHGDPGSADLGALRARPAWRELDAVKSGRVLVITAAGRPSPGLVDAIEDLARLLHPEAFADAARQAMSEER